MDKVLGLGNALVDIMTKLDDDIVLENFSLPRGSMQLVDGEFSTKLVEETKNLKQELSSGGSAANTINGLANLGIECGFVGTVGDDEYGSFFKNDMLNNNIKPDLFIEESKTGRAVALISPDSERTFATFLGAAIELSADHINEEIFDGYNYLYIEGYLVQNQDLIAKAVKTAKLKGLKVCLDLASYNVVEANLDFLKSIVAEYVDIVFANEEEAKAFTGQEPKQALDTIAEKCDIAIVKIGKDGSMIKSEGKIYNINPTEAVRRDTTGAGDLYASGFIYGLVKGLSFEKCGDIGTVLSGNVIEVIGAKMDKERWDRIHKMVKEIEN